MPEPRPDDWFQHAGFLRALARRLVADEARAEDAVQDTMLALLTRPPRESGNVRGWLARVLRREVGQARRGEGRRARREAIVARDEALPSDDQIVERMETTQRVTEAVLGLSEAYRAVIHLRYYEGLTAREIAERSGVPVETIRTREKRAVALLRERLDRRFGGDRGAWLGALAPVAGWPAPAPAAPAATLFGSTLASTAATFVMIKSHAALTVGAVAIVLLAVAWNADMLGARRGAPPAVDAPHGARSAAAEPGVESAPGPAVAGVRTEAAVAAAAPEPDAAPTADPGVVTLTGRLVLEGLDGAERTDASGGMRIGVEHAGRFAWNAVDVDEGRFALDVPRGASLRFARLRFDGLAAIPDRETIAAPGGGALELRARLVARPVLHVVDAATGAPLRDVEVRRRANWRAWGDDIHPGDSDEVSTVTPAADSPIVLPAFDRRCAYWARAEGYAWGRITIEHETGGERTLQLVPSGRLDVRVAGAEVPDGCFVRLRSFGERGTEVAAQKALGTDGIVAFEDLTPDEYRVFVEHGAGRDAVIVGFDRRTLAAGAHEVVDVALDLSKLDELRVPLAGRLRVPPELAGPGLTLRLSHQAEPGGRTQSMIRLRGEALAPVAGETADVWETYAWDAGEVLPGTYMVWVGPMHHREALALAVPGSEDVLIEVPPLARVTACFLDAASRAPVLPERTSWMDDSLDSNRFGNMSSDLHPDPDSGVATFTTCAGPVVLRVEDLRYGTTGHAFDLDPGENDLDVLLERVCSIRVSVFSEGARLSLHDESIELELTRADGEFAYRQRSGDGASETFVLVGPGDYRLRIEAGDVYERLEPIEIEVGPGEARSVRVDLVGR